VLHIALFGAVVIEKNVFKDFPMYHYVSLYKSLIPWGRAYMTVGTSFEQT